MSIATSRLSQSRKRGGFVLILILVLLVVVALLVTGFLAHSLSQVKTVTSYQAQTDNLLLSDVAVNLVKAQINDAISQSASIWASQPGAIRTFKNDGSDADYGTTYKLYSSSSLKSVAPQTDIPNDLPPTADPTGMDWNSSPIWTDLNAPVQKSDGSYAYPIIDVYNDPADLPGASFNSSSAMPPSFSITTNTVGAVTPLSKTTPPTLYPVPMPVQWLYILKQGQIIAPDSGAGASATITFNQALPQPTKANPIVGRVAYWTDDDTCRVNINTAGVSGTAATGSASAINTFWDTPRFTAPDDFALGAYQPYQSEYNRFPGHPAMTTLTLALPEFADSTGINDVSTTNMAKVLALTPRYGNGGSKGATVLSTSQTLSSLNTNRLYASINELLFNAPGTITAMTPTRSTSSLSRQQLETAKFFLTAHSRAPELNLFGLPRVAMWPISSQTGAQYRTATDNLIAFCSTNLTGSTNAGAGTYYFTRFPFTPNSSGGNGGQGGGKISNTGSNGTSYDVNLARNVSLLSYLDTLTSSAFPVAGNLGGGLSFDGKYGTTQMRQILTEIFDYIRITNVRDPNLDPTLSGISGATPYAAPTAYDPGNIDSVNGYGQVLPTQYATWGTYGFGRFQGILVGANIIFVGVGQGPPVSTPQTWTNYKQVNPFNISKTDITGDGLGPETSMFYDPPKAGGAPPANNPNNPSASTATDTPAGSAPLHFIPNPGQTAVEAVMAFTYFDPAMGYSRSTEWIHINATGLSGFTVASTATPSQQLFQSDTFAMRLGNQNGNDYADLIGANPASLGGLADFRMGLMGRQFSNSDIYLKGGYSNIINMPTGGTFDFGGATVTVAVDFGYGAPTNNTVHTYTFKFPSATLPVPAYSARPIMGAGNTQTSNFICYDRFGQRGGGYTTPAMTDANGGYYANFIDFPNDTVISMVPDASAGYGDYRMLAQPTVPSTAFVGHPLYVNNQLTAANRLAMDFMYPSGQVFQANTTYSAPPHGLLAPGVTSGTTPSSYFQQDTSMGLNLYSAAPVVPITQTTSPTAGLNGTTPPDFDNGFGALPDGPYINKPDEGAVYPSTVTAKVYYDNLGTQVNTTASPAFFFSPQRQVPSPVMFGSLPTGAPVGSASPLPTPKPWQTLLFQPGATGHFGLNAPKDEFLLDLFWMPQVLPYALSEPFSTAGKVNLNYQIFPFTYIDRTTALQSVLASEKVAQVGAANARTYKNYTSGSTTGGMASNARVPLNLSETSGTLSQFAQTFANFSVFRSVAQICEVYLVPQGASWPADSILDSKTHIATNSTAQTAFYGPDFALVGDNTRERPYADIYSRLTTKSNVYTVYYRVQALKNPSANPTTWTEGTGVINGEFRGSTTIERYIDPNQTVPDYASMNASALSGTTSLDNPTYYKWRVVENNRFAP